jgi:peptidoglycan/xylan/chitin deacetylase (PgdA/CDA1 family)
MKRCLLPILAALLVVVCSMSFAGNRDNVPASNNPPGGLSVKEAPQFVVLGFDDNPREGGLEWVLSLLSKYNIKASFYIFPLAASSSRVVELWKKAAEEGHEIGNHSYSHSEKLLTADYTTWRNEIDASTLWICSNITKQKISGFRAPYTVLSEASLSAAYDAGMLYDCSSWVNLVDDQFIWPYTLDSGLINIAYKDLGKYPGMWEIPYYPLKDGDKWVDGFDYTLWTTQTDAKKVLKLLKDSLDFHLNTNHSPMVIGLHSNYYDATTTSTWKITPSERQWVLEQFIVYALSKPEVRFVPAKELIQWMRNPRPLK